MNKYEAMFIVKSGLPEEERKNLFNQVGDAITKRDGTVLSGAVWAEKKKLLFRIKKQLDGLYYLVIFNAPGSAVQDINQAYKLNENILRVLITRVEEK
jgi:small subunit ribosomal protein S6